jgi:hypothetical protein
MVLRRLPNFSRRADKHWTCGPTVAHTQISNHRMRLRVATRLRVDASHFRLARTAGGVRCPPLLRKAKMQGKAEPALAGNDASLGY